MQATIRHEFMEAVVTYEDKPREQWVFDPPAQVRNGKRGEERGRGRRRGRERERKGKRGEKGEQFFITIISITEGDS